MSDPQLPEDGERRIPMKAPQQAAAPLTVSTAVLALRDELRVCDTHAASELALEHFWATHARTPILESNNPGRAFAEGHYTVTFLWQDADAEEVLLYANRITDERDLAASLMRRVPGTDLWHLSYRMRGDWRASYSFIRRLPGEEWPWAEGDQLAIRHALDRGIADPRNPRSCRNRQGTVMSVVSLPDAPPQPWLDYREGDMARGKVSERIGPEGRRVWVYEPPVLGASLGSAADVALPIVVLLDGEVWTSIQDIATTVDNLLADGEMRPCLVVMPESGESDPRWAERDTDGGTSAWIADQLLPWVREQYAASEYPSDVVVAGQNIGAYTALRTALEHPAKIGAVLSQSASMWQRRLPAPNPAFIDQLHVYLEVGSREWVLCSPNERLASEFARFGSDTHFVQYNGGHDYACWRGGIADGLRALLGPPASAAWPHTA